MTEVYIVNPNTQQFVCVTFRETSSCRLETPLGQAAVESLCTGQSSDPRQRWQQAFVFTIQIDRCIVCPACVCVISKLYGDQARYFDGEKAPRIKHRKKGTVSMVNNGNSQHGSQVRTMHSKPSEADKHTFLLVYLHRSVLSSLSPWGRTWTTWMECTLCLGRSQKAWTYWPRSTRPSWTTTSSRFRISGE